MREREREKEEAKKSQIDKKEQKDSFLKNFWKQRKVKRKSKWFTSELTLVVKVKIRKINVILFIIILIVIKSSQNEKNR